MNTRFYLPLLSILFALYASPSWAQVTHIEPMVVPQLPASTLPEIDTIIPPAPEPEIEAEPLPATPAPVVPEPPKDEQ